MLVNGFEHVNYRNVVGFRTCAQDAEDVHERAEGTNGHHQRMAPGVSAGSNAAGYRAAAHPVRDVPFNALCVFRLSGFPKRVDGRPEEQKIVDGKGPFDIAGGIGFPVDFRGPVLAQDPAFQDSIGLIEIGRRRLFTPNQFPVEAAGSEICRDFRQNRSGGCPFCRFQAGVIQVHFRDELLIRQPGARRDGAFHQANVAKPAALGAIDRCRSRFLPSRRHPLRIETLGGEPEFPPALPDVAAARGDDGVELIAVVLAHALRAVAGRQPAPDLSVRAGREIDVGANFIHAAPVPRVHGQIDILSLLGFVKKLFRDYRVVVKLGSVDLMYPFRARI